MINSQLVTSKKRSGKGTVHIKVVSSPTEYGVYKAGFPHSALLLKLGKKKRNAEIAKY